MERSDSSPKILSARCFMQLCARDSVAAHVEMNMRVIKTGNHAATEDIDDPRLLADEAGDVEISADRSDDAVLDC